MSEAAVVATPAPAAVTPAEPATHTEMMATVAAMIAGAPEEAHAEVAPVAIDPAPVEVKPPEPAKVEAPKALSALEQVAAERAALRKEREDARSKDAERAQKDALVKEYEEIKAMSKTDKVAVLNKLGMTFAELTEAVLSKGNKPPEPAEHPEVKAVREELAAMKAKMAETERIATEKAEQAAAIQGAQEIEAMAKAAPDKFPNIAELGLGGNVYNQIKTFQAKYGELPGGTVEAAIEWAMAKTEQAAQAEIDRVLQLPSVKARLAAAAPKPAVSSPQASVGQANPAVPRTLSNTQVSSAPPPAPEETNTTDRNVLVARAAKLLQG